MEPPAQPNATADGPTLGHPELRRAIAQFQTALWRYLRHLGADPDEADELVQESFVTAWSRPFSNRGEDASFAYLRSIARHAFLNHRRQKRRQLRAFCDAVDAIWDGYGPAAAAVADVRQEALRECLQQLDGRAREIVERHYGSGESRAEVARALEMKETGVKTRLQRIRASLRDCIERKTSQEDAQ